MYNNDTLVEQLVKREMTTKSKICKVLMIILCVMAILLVNIFPLFFGIGYLFILTGAISFAMGFGCYMFVTGMYKEYEYSVVNESFSIDIIRGKSRRSALFSGLIKDFEMVAKKDDERHPYSEFDKKDALHAECVSGTDPKNEWYIATKMGKQKVLITIEPNEKMLKAFFRMNPRNVSYRPGMKVDSKES